MANEVVFETSGALATVTLNRSDAMNAINGDLSNGLMDGLREARANDAIRLDDAREGPRACAGKGQPEFTGQ